MKESGSILGAMKLTSAASFLEEVKESNYHIISLKGTDEAQARGFLRCINGLQGSLTRKKFGCGRLAGIQCELLHHYFAPINFLNLPNMCRRWILQRDEAVHRLRVMSPHVVVASVPEW